MVATQSQIDLSQLTTHFQAIMDLDSWRVCGVEALARDKAGNSLFPTLERAKHEGWYSELEGPLIEIAVREAAKLPKNLLCTLNMSSDLVMDNVLARILSSQPTRQWGVELLEDSARNPEFEEFRSKVDELECILLVDDAGVCNSDELRIRYLKPTIVKLDRLLLIRAFNSVEGRTRLESLILESRAHGCMLLAEGVETPEQLNFALELGCEYAQGWYFGPAVPASEVPQQIAELEQRLWIDAR